MTMKRMKMASGDKNCFFNYPSCVFMLRRSFGQFEHCNFEPLSTRKYGCIIRTCIVCRNHRYRNGTTPRHNENILQAQQDERSETLNNLCNKNVSLFSNSKRILLTNLPCYYTDVHRSVKMILPLSYVLFM